jgi:sulfate adenylyltransferase subunit 1 (EFTu-like GTPase family)
MNVSTSASKVAVKGPTVEFTCATFGGAVIATVVTVDDEEPFKITAKTPVKLKLSREMHICRVDILVKAKKALNRHFGVIVSVNAKPIATAIGNLPADDNDDFGHARVNLDVQ